VYPTRVDLGALVSCAALFSVGGYVPFHMLARGILLRLRLGYAPGQTRGLWFWFPLTAEQALEKSHHPTSYLAAIVPLGQAGVNGAPRILALAGLPLRFPGPLPFSHVLEVLPHPRVTHLLAKAQGYALHSVPRDGEGQPVKQQVGAE
jgi:hypothetical protein